MAKVVKSLEPVPSSGAHYIVHGGPAYTVVVIEHKHGTDAWVCNSEEAAEALLTDWAWYWWDNEFDEPRPPIEDIKDEYFDRMSEKRNDWESYIILDNVKTTYLFKESE